MPTKSRAIRAAVKRRSKLPLMLARSNEGSRQTASTAPSTLDTKKPIPSSIISGTDPARQAMVGFPFVIASIMIRSKGSGQSIGKSNARALPRKAFFQDFVYLPHLPLAGC
jgi:hypothetical protein